MIQQLRRFHLYMGIIITIIFLLTGQYMMHFYDYMGAATPLERVLFRTGHLYILLVGFIHLMLGCYFQIRKDRFRRIAQILGSILITISSILIILSFIFELPTESVDDRPMAIFGLFIVFGGALLHLVANIRLVNKKLTTPKTP